MPGQINAIDVEVLRSTVAHYKPQACIEIGTRNGDGTTAVIADALPDGALLYTIEMDPRRVAAAEKVRRCNTQQYLGRSMSVLPYLLKSIESFDFLMIDGGDGHEPVAELRMCEPYMGPGSILCIHDWDTIKTRELRENLENWELVAEAGMPGGIILDQGMYLECPGIAVLQWAI
jgi:predicted O-methyltransferase YrrM